MRFTATTSESRYETWALKRYYRRRALPGNEHTWNGSLASIRRECLDRVVVFDERSLRRTLACYFDYYHRSRTHLSLGKGSPELRPIQRPEIGPVVVLSQVGGLHHRYERRPA